MSDETLNPADEADIIDPDIEIELDGMICVVREFAFLQGLKMAALAKPLLDDLSGSLQQGETLDLELLQQCFASHADIFIELLVESIGWDSTRISLLSDRAGQLLTLTFWRVNKDFFVNRLLTRKLATATQNRPDSLA